MKNTKTISGAFYAVLAAFQMFLLRYVLSNVGITDVPISMLVEVAMAVVFTVLAICLLASGGKFEPKQKEKLLVGTVLYLIFIALYYEVQITIITYAMMSFSQANAAPGTGVSIALLVVKIVLLVAPVVLAILPEKTQAAEETEQTEAAEAEETATEETTSEE